MGPRFYPDPIYIYSISENQPAKPSHALQKSWSKPWNFQNLPKLMVANGPQRILKLTHFIYSMVRLVDSIIPLIHLNFFILIHHLPERYSCWPSDMSNLPLEAKIAEWAPEQQTQLIFVVVVVFFFSGEKIGKIYSKESFRHRNLTPLTYRPQK